MHELPEYKSVIHDLKVSDRRFSKLFTEYHDLDHEIYRFEICVENCDDAHLEERKKLRLSLKDQLLDRLKKAP
ncbi:MAG: YdcH family protein [Candidatus Reddybacter sp.]